MYKVSLDKLQFDYQCQYKESDVPLQHIQGVAGEFIPSLSRLFLHEEPDGRPSKPSASVCLYFCIS